MNSIILVSLFQDKEYLQELHHALPCILQAFQPDIVLYNAGVDPHVRDDLGRLKLTDMGLQCIITYPCQVVEICSIKFTCLVKVKVKIFILC